jgi:PiT family inorganic phosphate transporter
MAEGTIIVAIVVVFGLGFDFTNGFHDTANAMATSVATGALSPRVAVALSGVLNFVGAFLSLAVATTIATGIVNPNVVTTTVVFAGLVGAITWNLITWLFGLPSSSSHAVIGGTIGAAIVGSGWGAIQGVGIVSKVLVPALFSPVIAALAAGLSVLLAFRIVRRARPDFVKRAYRIGQVASASLVSLAHGTIDAQKTMGIITLALISNGNITTHSGVPEWVVITCAGAIALGTYAGGWRVIRTVGKGITEINTTSGFVAESVSSAVIMGAASLGFAVSTTQVASGSVIGVGVGRREPVRWNTVGQMVAAWVITIPSAAVFGGTAAATADWIGGVPGVVVVALIAAGIYAAIYAASRRQPVTADNVNAPIPKGALSALAIERRVAT